VPIFVDFGTGRRQSLPHWSEILCEHTLLGGQRYSWWLHLVCMHSLSFHVRRK